MSLENPLSILFNAEGNELAVSASQVLTGSGIQPGILVAGSSSTGTVQFMRVADNGSVFVTGSVSVDSIAIGSVDQGNAGTVGESWYFRLTDGTQVIGTGSSAPVWVSGAVDILNPIVVTDGGGSLTVDGTVAVSNFPAVQSVDDNGGSLTVDDGGSSLTVDGTVSVDNFPVTQSVQIGGIDNGVVIPVTGSFTMNFDPSTSATVTEVASSATVVTLQAANGSRRGLTVFNSSNKTLYLKLGSGAALNSFTVKMSSQGYYEVPGNYTGIVTGIWDSVNGNAYVTEILD